MDALSAQWMKERSQTQITLGKLIDALCEKGFPEEVSKIARPHSYRGYYSDLSFEPEEGLMSRHELLIMLKECMGEIFHGYKGGEFQMGRNTPLWIAEYGSCGKAIAGVSPDGSWILKEDGE